MVLARADLAIAARHAALAGRWARDLQSHREFERTCTWVLELSGSHDLLDRDPTLPRSIRLRNPYVDPMSFL